MSMRFNPPPNWPDSLAGWEPPSGWRPDPSWGPPPPGWQLWVHDSIPQSSAAVVGPVAQSSGGAGNAMVVVAAASCGLAGFVPPLWAARQRSHDRAFRRRMYAVSGGLFAIMALGMVLPSEADNGGNELLSNLAGTLLVLNWVLSVTVAVLLRKTRPSSALPGVAEGRARRRLRAEYRELAVSDPVLALSMGIGRPTPERTLDDGGLVDLNWVPADQLAPLTGLSAEESNRVVEARQRLGRFSSVEEVALYADLSDTTTALLGDRALFF